MRSRRKSLQEGRLWRRCGGALVLAFLAVSEPPHAHSSEKPTPVKQVDLARGSLSQSLLALSELYGIQILAPSELTQNRQAQALNGSFSVEEALQSLLSEFGLEARPRSNGAYVVEAAPAAKSRPAVQPLETVIVRGTKRNLSIQDTQTSVSVFTDIEIDEQAIYNLADVLLRTPNVSTGTAVSELSIRGIEVGGVGNAGVAATANVYVDGAPASISGRAGPFNLWDVSQIEILRGPQSTIQGRNSLAGAIVIETADPEYEPGVDLRVLVGDNENRQGSMAVTGPIIDDQLAFRLAVDYREIDYGVIDVSTGDPAFFDEDLTIRGKLLLEPSAVPGLRIELNSQYVDSEGGSNFAIFSPVLFSDPAFASFDPFGDETFPQVRDTREETLRNIVDVSYELSEHWDFVTKGTYETTEAFRNRITGVNDNTEDTYSLELRAVFDYARVRGWIGAYGFREDLESNNSFIVDLGEFGFATDPPGGIVTSNLLLDRETENYALFADVTWDLTPQVSLSIGARYDYEDLFDTGFQGSASASVDPCTIPALGGLPCTSFFPATSEPPVSTDYNAFLPRGSLVYHFAEDKSLSFSVQRGYRAGGVIVEATDDGGRIREFDPEFITNYEIAYRSQWLDGRLTINTNAFLADWTDQQVRIRDRFGGATLFVINAAGSEFYGAELYVSYDLSPALSLFATLGVLNTEFTDFPFGEDELGNPIPGDGVTLPVENTGFANLAGNEFPFAPPLTASVGLSYAADNGFIASANVAYTDRQFSDVENLPVNQTDEFVLVNARLGYRWDRYDISLFANNLLDERFVTRQFVQSISTANQQLRLTDGNGQFRVNTPRVVGLELQASF